MSKFHKLSPEQEEALIEEVRPFPCLFDINDDLYKDSIHKSEIFRKIGLKLGLDGSVVKDAWNSIRQKYKRESKKVKAVRSGAGSKEVHEPAWTHWRSLAFLKDIREDIVTSGNLESLWRKADSKEMDNHNLTQDLTSPRPSRSCNVLYVDECNPSITRSLVLPASTLRNQKSDVPSLKKNQSDTDEEHEDRIFFTSLLLHVKKVPQANKLAMRNEITKIVNKYAYTMRPPEPRLMRAVPQPLMIHPSNVPFYYPVPAKYRNARQPIPVPVPMPYVKQELQLPMKRSRDTSEQDTSEQDTSEQDTSEQNLFDAYTCFSDDDDCQILEVGKSEKVFRSEDTKPFQNPPPRQRRKKAPATSTSTNQPAISSTAASSTSSQKGEKTKSSTQPSSEEILALIYKKLMREEKETVPQTVSQTLPRQSNRGTKKVEKLPKKTAAKREENSKKIEKCSSKMNVKVTDLQKMKDGEWEKEAVEMEKEDEDTEKEEEEMETETDKEQFENGSEEED